MITRAHRFTLVTLVAWSVASLSGAEPNVVSPEVAPDRRVTLRILAPNAAAVALQGVIFKEPQPMTKDREGVWSITVGPLPPEIYSYTFSIDGAAVTDPRNRNVKKWLRNESAFEVPGSPPLLASSQPGPHGIVHRLLFSSKTRGREDAIQVYTPPGFDPRSTTKYPIVYLLHGYGDDETAWIDAGRANFIADNLIAQHRIVPAIIVMTNGHPIPLPTTAPVTDYSAKNSSAMEHELLTEIIPLVEATYPARPGAENRAITGLSMGGSQALAIGLTHLETFGWIGGFSSGPPPTELEQTFSSLLSATKASKGAPHLLWIGVGRDDFLLEPNKAFVAWLDAHHVAHSWTVSEGGHTWFVWRRNLADFLPLVFR